MALLRCYNKSCTTGEFREEENKDESCRYHPGGPIFHEGLKGWSCCKKRFTDFTEFLNNPGCTVGKHSNVKPEAPAPVEKMDEDPIPQPIKKEKPTEVFKPDENKRIVVNLSQSRSAKTAYDKFLARIAEEKLRQSNMEKPLIALGTGCYNKSCDTKYEGEQTLQTECIHHPGEPLFHEGLKSWTCCDRKTSDFQSFLNQAGCNTGEHCFVKPVDAISQKVDCRYDFFQTDDRITLSIYTKNVDPDNTILEVTCNKLIIFVVFEQEKIFDKTIELMDYIVAEETKGEILGSKIEIKLKKFRPAAWNDFERL